MIRQLPGRETPIVVWREGRLVKELRRVRNRIVARVIVRLGCEAKQGAEGETSAVEREGGGGGLEDSEG